MIRNRAFLADVPAKVQRPDPSEDRAYLDWVRANLPCVVTLEFPAEVHHLRRDERGPIGGANHDDRRVLPLSAKLHRQALHDKLGERSFFAYYGIEEYVSLAAMIRCAFEIGDIAMAQTAILNARPR